MVTYMEYQRELENSQRLKRMADRICRDIIEAGIRDEKQLAARMEEARELCQELFPDRAELFEMVYQSRFLRLWDQFGGGGKKSSELF